MKYILMIAMSWIFLPSRYSDAPPVKPFVAALPAPHFKISAWRTFHQHDRTGGYHRVERFNW